MLLEIHRVDKETHKIMAYETNLQKEKLEKEKK